MDGDEWRPEFWLALTGVAGAFLIAAAVQFATVDRTVWAGIALSMAAIVSVGGLAALSAHTPVPRPATIGIVGTIAIAVFAFVLVMSSG